MSLRLIDPEETREVELHGVKIFVKSMSVVEKERLAHMIIDNKNLTFSELVKEMSKHIAGIEGYADRPPREVLEKFEYMDDLLKLYGLMVSQLTDDEAKNSESSPDGSLTESPAGTAESNVVKVDVPASITTEYTQPTDC